MTAGPLDRPDRPVRLLLYAMYDPSAQDSAPKVRIRMIGEALERRARLERIEGGRGGRALAGLRWLLGGGLGRVDAIYVESATSTATPFDLALLALARIRGRPVGVYFRDAYQRFRHLFPARRPRQRLADLAWRFTMPLMRRVATRCYAPSEGLATVLGLDDATLLPPGTDPSMPDLGAAASHLVAAVTAPTTAAGFDRLVDAVRIVRARVGDARLRIITSVPATGPLPEWVDLVPGARPALPALLRDARVCVIPLPLTLYTRLAIPVRLMDLLAMGKPTVVTASDATIALLGSSEAALCCGDTPEAMAAAIERLLTDDDLAASLAARARSFACEPENTWDARAATIVRTLVPWAAT